MKGNLDAKQLETWQKKDLQSLARQLGISDEGTIKELSERISKVDIEEPHDCETTPTEILEAAKTEAESILENARREVEQIVQNAKGNKEPKDTTVECTERYYDTELCRVIEVGEQLDVTRTRADKIINAGFAKLVLRD